MSAMFIVTIIALFVSAYFGLILFAARDDGIVVTLYPAQWYAITERVHGVALVGSTIV